MFNLKQLYVNTFHKKILLVFTLSTFIPIATLALFSSEYISTAIEKEVKSSLIKNAKSYGLLSFDKLISLSNQLATINVSADEAITDELVSNFDSLELIPIDTTNNFDAFIKPRLYLYKADSADLVFGIEVRHKSKTGQSYLLKGTFSSSKIFGDQIKNPFNEPICIFNDDKVTLFCNESISLQKGVLETAYSLLGSKNRIAEKEFSNKSYIFASWELFLPTHFQSGAWHFVIMKPSSIALQSIQNVNKVLLPIALLFFILVAYFLHRITLRLLSPLNEIHSATKLLSHGDYNIHLDVSSKDEFQALSESFNLMSANINQTIIKDRVFAKLQREVISTLNMHTALEACFLELLNLFQSDALAISFVDPLDNSRLDCHSMNISFGSPINDYKFLSIEHVENDVEHSQTPIPLNEFNNIYTNHASLLTSPYIYCFKIKDTNNVFAYIFFGVSNNNHFNQQRLLILNELIEQLRIAYTTHNQQLSLNKKANFDELTGLPNRNNIMEYLTSKWSFTNKKNTDLAILFVDLDNFKNVNDLSGHRAGNEVLVQVASRLQNCVKNRAMIARLGGDEFCILLEDLTFTDDAIEIAKAIILQFKRPFLVGDMPFYLGTSIGIAIGSINCSSAEQLLENADLAMFKAKQDGKNRFVTFDISIQKDRNYRLSLEHHLHTALDANELSIKFQPKINLATGKLVSAESLIRWHQRDLGFIDTELFISLAEESGLINEIGRWILRKSCYQFMDWRNKGIIFDSIAVNVSARQLTSKRFIDVVRSVLEETKIPPHCLDLEITESAFINDDEFLTNELLQLHNLGVQISIDDFGKEYSSLSYLKKIPFDNLKIDREFIMELDTDHRDEHIVNVIISIGHTLDKKIIAEGIETASQRDILIKHGCDIGQGYFYSKPLSDIEFLEFAVNCAKEHPSTTLLSRSS